ncbi:MAG: hypothetical protein JXA67_11840 [Micromonosporaceae bacterium]|nr:hypothetical protein [Micromonosporaceae bacterium]
MDAGYVYDAFGRTTAQPGGLTNSYFANDLVWRQQLEDAQQTWTLDPAHRFRAFTAETLVNDSWVNSSSKLNHYDDDSDEPRWIVEDTSLGAVTRNVSGPDGDLAATTSATGDVRLQLVSLHGDVAATIDTGLTGPELFDYDEFGAPMPDQATQRYGWLGGKQRSGEALGDLVLMGVRLYGPALGRFLQVDPVPGGNCNGYEYACADPVNKQDVTGKWVGLVFRGAAAACRLGRGGASVRASTLPNKPGAVPNGSESRYGAVPSGSGDRWCAEPNGPQGLWPMLFAIQKFVAFDFRTLADSVVIYVMKVNVGSGRIFIE